MTPPRDRYRAFFGQATGLEKPHPYQAWLATAPNIPTLPNIPTSLGKSAAVVLTWLFRRREHPNPTLNRTTPRRLVYCLTIRTRVEQIYGNEGMTFREIGERLDVHGVTAVRSCDER